MRETPAWSVLQILSGLPPNLKFEARRKAIHVFGAIFAVFAFLLLPFWWAVGLALFTILVIAVAHFVRRHRIKVAAPLEMITTPLGDVIDATRRPHEDFPWAPVTFALALVAVGVAITFAGLDKAFAFAAYGILGMGDAASALIGIAYGKHKLPWNRRKSWEGTAAGLVAAFISALLLASLDFSVRGHVLPLEWIGIALAGAVAGALVESLPRVQDNLFVPPAALVAMVGVARVLGLA